MALIPLGGKFYYENREVYFWDTCNIDCTIQIIFYLYRFTDKGRQFFALKNDDLGQKIKRIFSHMEKKEVQLARLIWVREILGIQEQRRSLEGEERDQGFSAFKKSFGAVCVPVPRIKWNQKHLTS